MLIWFNCWTKSIQTRNRVANLQKLFRPQWKTIRNSRSARSATANREWGLAVRPRWCGSNGPVESKPTTANATACTCWITPWIDSALSCPPFRRRPNWPKSKLSALRTITSGPCLRLWISSEDTIHRAEASRWMSATSRSASATKAVPSHRQQLRTTPSFPGTIAGRWNLLYLHSIRRLHLHPLPAAEASARAEVNWPTTISTSSSINWPTRKPTTSSSSSHNHHLKFNNNRRGCRPLRPFPIIKWPIGRRQTISTTSITFPILPPDAPSTVTTRIPRQVRDITTCYHPNSRVYKETTNGNVNAHTNYLAFLSYHSLDTFVCKSPRAAEKKNDPMILYQTLPQSLDLIYCK